MNSPGMLTVALPTLSPRFRFPLACASLSGRLGLVGGSSPVQRSEYEKLGL